MTILLLLLQFIKSYWKPLLVVSIPIGCLLGGYWYGHRAATQKMKLREAANLIERVNKGIEVEKEFRDKKIKYRKDKEVKPVDDKRDSCILSNLPDDLESCLNSTNK